MAEKRNPKVMPNNVEAEQSLLACLLIDDSVATEALSELNVDDFYYQSHKYLYLGMYELQRDGKPIDIITLSEKLKNLTTYKKLAGGEQEVKVDVFDNIGGFGYLTELTNVMPSAANYRYYFDIVKKNSMLRKIIGTTNEIIENTYASDDADQALAFAEKKVFAISDSTENKDLIHVNDTVIDVLHGYEKVLTDPDCIKGQLTYFKNLDKITNGYKGGQMIVLAARPGCGKTSFAMNVVCNIARKEPEKVVAVFNLEMSISELTQRILLTMASVPHENVQRGATMEEFKRLWKAKEELEKSNIYIDDTANTTPEQIMSKCRRLKQMKRRLDLVVIDYIQLLKAKTSRQSIQQEVTEISRSIKILAKELDVPVIALSQTSRDLEKDGERDPKLSDLRESGAIEQDADQVYFLVKQRNQEENDVQVIDLHIIKHRSGPCAKISFKWEGSMVKFTPLTLEEAKSIKESSKIVEKAINASTQNDSKVATDNEDVLVSGVDRIDIEDLTPPPIDDNFATSVDFQVENTAQTSDEEPDWGAEFAKATSNVVIKNDIDIEQ